MTCHKSLIKTKKVWSCCVCSLPSFRFSGCFREVLCVLAESSREADEVTDGDEREDKKDADNDERDEQARRVGQCLPGLIPWRHRSRRA